jgi:2-polyprenyl-3-methyl-5-hydroxy-6-metoxy-1,4-benzoquinol methylase
MDARIDQAEVLDDRVGYAFSRFTETGDPLWWGGRLVYQELLGRVGGKAVVDVGCGVGAGAAWLATQARRVVGLDKNPRAVAFAQMMNPMVQWRCWDIALYPFVEYSADVVTCVECIEHIEDAASALRNMLRMAPEVWLSTPNRDGAMCKARTAPTLGHVREYVKDDLYLLARSAGGLLASVDLLAKENIMLACVRRMSND